MFVRTLLADLLFTVINQFFRAFLTQTGCFIQMLWFRAEETLSHSQVEHCAFLLTLVACILLKVRVRCFNRTVFGVKFCGDFEHFKAVLFLSGRSIVPILRLEVVFKHAVIEISQTCRNLFQKFDSCSTTL